MAGKPGTYQRKRHKGFRHAGSLVSERVRVASESKGFAVSRLLTHWAEIAGSDLAARARPLNVSYGRGGLGATLTLLTTGAYAPIIEMQAERLRERVNACYGYNAISRIRITQTAPSGFREGRVDFNHAPVATTDPEPSAQARQKARTLADGISDADLRNALETMGGQVLTRTRTQAGKS